MKIYFLPNFTIVKGILNHFLKMKLKELALSAIAHLGIASQASSTPSGFSDDASERIQDAVCATMPEFHECTTP